MFFFSILWRLLLYAVSFLFNLYILGIEKIAHLFASSKGPTFHIFNNIWIRQMKFFHWTVEYFLHTRSHFHLWGNWISHESQVLSNKYMNEAISIIRTETEKIKKCNIFFYKYNNIILIILRCDCFY